ncbi:hypothetical protein FF36_02815 [Frankia torreyi]|uniref:Uncharacterized protein n=1 Tax=Frankia torreyi TaxID=1856 RepID=A0A0D8BHE5_9ACTN|nr:MULTISPECIES: hypothetical protein [Frankia]KJE22837.1 hypothetical protein FF36_02815 [Frankia torreyi]KQC40256.1 hypothetical protein UK82_01140 [Frankia sp. ACN1ag]KQM04883.1 hypothetical protein FF86_102141 [Frankia sp. CpI1-P]
MARQGGRPGWLREPDPLQNPIGSRLAILGMIALIIGGAVAIVTGGEQPASGLPAGGTHASTPAPVSTAPVSAVPVSAENDAAELASWYHGSEGLRIRVATDVATVRSQLAAQNGAALKPACATLGTDISAAITAPVPPTAGARARYDAGGRGYTAATASCAQLFDGTRIEVGVLQQRIRTSLADGDREWAALAAIIGQPMATAAPAAP